MSLENGAQAAVQKTQAKPQPAADPMFTVSASPHIRCDETIQHIMWQVIWRLRQQPFLRCAGLAYRHSSIWP